MPITQGLPETFGFSGVSIPAVGLGTFQGDDGNRSQVKEAVLTALRHGYRHIDTAAAYGNEREVGDAIKEWYFEERHLCYHEIVRSILSSISSMT
jgi:diketogulonate reductase-like aldo/keto reductase